MASARLLSKNIILSRKLNMVSEGAENLYYRILVMSDDFGCYHADSAIIKGKIYTLRQISLSSIEERLQELTSINLIKMYEVNGESYVQIVKFEDHQKFRSDIKRKESYPQYEQRSRNESERIRTNPNMEKGTVNRNRSNNKGENENEYPLEFRLFWHCYPKPIGKKVALNAWNEHPKKNYKELILAAKNYRALCDYKKTEMDYIKEPSGFIRIKKEYWKDYVEIEVPKEAGESQLPEKTPEKKKADEDYVKARLKKRGELSKKYKYKEAKTSDEIDEIDNKIQNELASWTKEYYGHKVEPNL